MKKKLKVLVLFDGVQPTPIDADLSKEMKTEDWKTEANVMAALGELGHTAEHLAIFDDVDLRQLFSAPAGIKASSYLRQRRRRIMNSVAQFTNEKKFRVNKLLTRLIDRSDELGLRVQNDDPQQDFRVASYITTLVMNYLFTGKFKRTK